ncbi:MAG: peptidoglycan DD-metalloendopeptidase family protein [Fermentimonas sp.]|jgi:murein DD-endopeptidase MepM/ murein hydrolase activator NlpD
MKIEQFFSKVRVVVPAMFAFVSLNTFAQQLDNPAEKDRPEVTYKQMHSTDLSGKDGLFADGLKLKLDLSVLDEAEEEREAFNPEDIPADDIYGGVWENRFVNVYGSLKNAPDTFIVDLENFTMPAPGRMTSNFGRRGSRRYHYGIDIKAQTGDTIYAAFDGKIRVKQFERRGYGYYIVIRHVNGLETVYGHLSKFLVNENDFVKSGQPIGLAGNTGRSYGSHLHFETRFLGKPINPNFIINFEEKRVYGDEYLVTNKSYNKTNNSSSRVIKSSKDVQAVLASNNSRASSNSGDNKFVNGDVKYHKIKKGETLGAISKKYGTTVSELCRLNNISSRTTLRIGRSIRVS